MDDMRLTDERLCVLDHPLVDHKLAIMRDETTTPSQFRQMVHEISMLEVFEATRDLPTEAIEVKTPLQTMTGRHVPSNLLAVVPILRAGMGMLDGVLSVIPSAAVGVLGMERNEETHQTIVTAMGEAAVETLLARMKEQAKVEARLVPVRIPYRETICKTAEAQGRHKKQTGGAGQFGDCWLRISPNPGAGYEFVDEIKGGAIPGGLIPAVDKGVQEAMAEGFLAGYPMVDIKCAVFDGSYHSVDSNEMAFKTAARIGFRAACEQADPILLEPMANMDIVVTEEYAGTVMGDISTRRGRIVGTDSTDEGETVIMVRVPYAEVVSYTKDLRAMTRGSGSYFIQLEGYDPAPVDVTKKLIAEYQASRA